MILIYHFIIKKFWFFNEISFLYIQNNQLSLILILDSTLSITLQATKSPITSTTNCENNPAGLLFAITTNPCFCPIDSFYSDTICTCALCSFYLPGCTSCLDGATCLS